jgi:hypothetical protein
VRENGQTVNADQFWLIVESAREAAKRDWWSQRDVLVGQRRHLLNTMRGLDPFEMVVFSMWWGRFSGQADRPDIRSALICSTECGSDDYYLDFRQTLVCFGQHLFARVLQNADNLVEVIERWEVSSLALEGIAHVAGKAYREATGEDDVPEHVYAQAAAVVDRQPDRLPPITVPVFDGDFDHFDLAEVRKRFPRLAARLPEAGDLL